MVAWWKDSGGTRGLGRVLPVQAKQELKQSKTRQNKEIVWLGTFHITMLLFIGHSEYHQFL